MVLNDKYEAVIGLEVHAQLIARIDTTSSATSSDTSSAADAEAEPEDESLATGGLTLAIAVDEDDAAHAVTLAAPA